MFRHVSLISPPSIAMSYIPGHHFFDYLGTWPTLRRKCACGANIYHRENNRLLNYVLYFCKSMISGGPGAPLGGGQSVDLSHISFVQNPCVRQSQAN